MEGERVCKNCRFVKEHAISFNGGKTIHSYAYSCKWGASNKLKRVPYWMQTSHHTVVANAPARKRGCDAFQTIVIAGAERTEDKDG